MYKGQCTVIIMGEKVLMPPVRLNSPREIFNYIQLQRNLVHEIVVEDKEEYCVIHVVNGKIIFPVELSNR